jgi:rRNA-processing protein FCF1
VYSVQTLLIDACGWVACRHSSINIDNEAQRYLGKPQWIVLDVVLEELEHLLKEKTISKSAMLLDLLKDKALVVDTSDVKGTHTDDLLIESALQHNSTLLTVDVELKRRAYQLNIPILEVRKGHRLHLVDSV